MAASRPDEAHRVIGREKEKDTVGMSRESAGGGKERVREKERARYRDREESTLS